jgi:drug/metabolite transporter (DMT)-like permease
MSWIIFTLLAIMSRAIMGLGTKLLSNRLAVSAGMQTSLFGISDVVLALSLSPLLGGLDFAKLGHYWPQVVAMIVLSGVANIIYFVGQRHLGVGAAQVGFSSILIWGAILSAIFLHSTFSALQLGGIVLLLIAILVAQFQRNAGKVNTALALIVLSAIAFAALQVIGADLSRHVSVATFILVAFIGLVVAPFVFMPKTMTKDIRALKSHSPRPVLEAMGLVGSTSFLYYVFTYLAYRAAPDRGVVVVLLTAQVIVAVLLGIIFLHERQGMRRKLVAGLLAVIAGMMIKS